MKKSYLITGIIYIIAGLLFLILAMRTATEVNSILYGMAGAGIGPGLMMVFRYFYWQKPENQQRYQEKLENERIELHDELKEKLRDRAGWYAYIIGLLVICAAILVFSILGQLEIITGYRLLVIFLFAYLVFQYLLGMIIFKRLLKKF